MYLLDSFTSGMYNDPLIVYREYIQNAVDSIDLARRGDANPLEVEILLEPNMRRITIRDNAMGVPASLAEEVLSSIGSSKKTQTGLRGFRGIGRLGGVAFCDKALFRTKAKNESAESIQEWNCEGLRRLLSEPKKEFMSLEEVFLRATTFRQERCDKIGESYFEVTLHGVSSFRNQLFDIEKVKRYLAQVAPVPFRSQEFRHSRAIDEYLSSKLSSYGRYNIILNGQPIHKPYKDIVKISKGDHDHVDEIEFFEIKNGKTKPIAYGWYGKRRELLGSIARGDDSSGIRVRVGNIQIGDAHLLDDCFREPRFNGYVSGEVHVECSDLIPNSRRDDFVDNLKKGLFYNLIEKDIGLPISKEIRLRSRLASTPRPNGDEQLPACQETCACDPSVESSFEEAKRGELAGAAKVVPPPATDFPAPDDEPRIPLSETLKNVCSRCPNLPKLFEILGRQRVLRD
jgi:molecular chaperone HtpG